jgi:hypothetical protein
MDDLVRTKQPNPPGLYFQGWLGEAQELVQRLGLRDCPVVAEPGFLPSELETGAEEPDFAVTMMSLNLVDVSSLSWHHIRECRRDRTAQMKLRRLRLFFAQNYAGKTRQYIEDGLSVALNDYADTVKAWGFETRTQVATMLLTSKWLAGAIGGSALALILHSPLTSLITGASALTIELGQVSLEVVKRQHALRRLTDSSPISYLADLRAASGSRRKMLSRK